MYLTLINVNVLVMRHMTDDEVRAGWCQTRQAVHSISHELENELQRHHDLGLSEFEVLDVLSGECDTAQSKMKRLESKLHLSQSALSRTVTRLEKAGLVARSACDTDRRATFLDLTQTGRQRWSDAAATHLDVLRRNVHKVGKQSLTAD